MSCRWDLVELDLIPALRAHRALPNADHIDPAFTVPPAAKTQGTTIESGALDLWKLRRPDPDVAAAQRPPLTEAEFQRYALDARSGEQRSRPWLSSRRAFTATVMLDHSLMIVAGMSARWTDVLRLEDGEKVVPVGWPGFDHSLQCPVPVNDRIATLAESENHAWQPLHPTFKTVEGDRPPPGFVPPGGAGAAPSAAAPAPAAAAVPLPFPFRP